MLFSLNEKLQKQQRPPHICAQYWLKVINFGDENMNCNERSVLSFPSGHDSTSWTLANKNNIASSPNCFSVALNFNLISCFAFCNQVRIPCIAAPTRRVSNGVHIKPCCCSKFLLWAQGVKLAVWVRCFFFSKKSLICDLQKPGKAEFPMASDNESHAERNSYRQTYRAMCIYRLQIVLMCSLQTYFEKLLR